MTNNVIVLYNSKTGFTRRYAELIGQELGCTVRPLTDAPSPISASRRGCAMRKWAGLTAR